MEPLLSIGAFARKTRLSMKALRLYARLGLLAPVHIDSSNGYRWYRHSQLATARLIGLLRRLDMPLNQDWESVERRITSQRLLAAHLQIRLSGTQGDFLEMFDVQQRDVPEQKVITEQRHVLVSELSGWLHESIGRLMGLAFERYGGAANPVFVVYYGEVNQDSDGPVEVCVPIAADAQIDGVPMRTEPAHREAFVRITRAQVEFPQILSAYDAVSQWINEGGHTMVGAPREIYFTDFEAAAPTDEVADIAFPMR